MSIRAPLAPSPRFRPDRQPPLRPAPSTRPLRVVGPKERSATARRRRARLAAVGIVGLIAAGLFGVVVLRVVLTQNQFRLDQMRTDATTQQARYQRLRLQVAELESPERIVATAQQKLGMVQPPSIIYLAPVLPSPAQAGSDPTSTSPSPSGDIGAAASGAWSTVKPELAARP